MTKRKQLVAVMLAAACIGLAAWMLTPAGVDSAGVEAAGARPLELPPRASAHERLEVPEESGRERAEARAVLAETPPADTGAPPAAADSPVPGAPGSIAGRVRTEAGLPIADVEIVLERESDASTGWARRSRNEIVIDRTPSRVRGVEAKSDASGLYRFENIDPGSYSVMLFDRSNALGRQPPEWRRSVVLDPGASRENVDFVLASEGTIVGRVLDPDGLSVENAVVSVARALRLDGASRSGKASPPHGYPTPVRTGVQGTFCLSGLRSGDYVLHVEPPRLSSADDHGTQLAAADSLAIATGDVHARIFLRRLAAVSGVVRAPDGGAWPHAGVIAKNAEGREIGVTYADADGRFELQVPEDAEIDLMACPSRPLGGGMTGWSMNPGAAGRALRGVRAGSSTAVLELARSH